MSGRKEGKRTIKRKWEGKEEKEGSVKRKRKEGKKELNFSRSWLVVDLMLVLAAFKICKNITVYNGIFSLLNLLVDVYVSMIDSGQF